MTFTTAATLGMSLLFTEGFISIAYGAFRQLRSPKNSLSYYFGQMFWLWGLINGSISALPLRSLHSQEQRFNSDAAFQHQQVAVIVFNIGLDLVYAIVGITLLKRGRSDRLRGYGRAIVLQGLFLLVFDTILAISLSQIAR